MWIHRKAEPVTLLGVGLLTSQTANKKIVHFLSALQKLPAFAHHPSCKYYYNHLIWIGKIPLCMGCTMMSLGIVIGVLLIPVLSLSILPFEYVLIMGVLLYIPALIQLKVQRRTYKLLARTSLGISVTFLIYAGLWLTSWSIAGLILKIGFLVIFLTVWQLTLRLRTKLTQSPCDRCPEGRFPICSYTNSRIQKLSDLHFRNSENNDPEVDEIIKAFKELSSYYSL